MVQGFLIDNLMEVAITNLSQLFRNSQPRAEQSLASFFDMDSAGRGLLIKDLWQVVMKFLPQLLLHSEPRAMDP